MKIVQLASILALLGKTALHAAAVGAGEIGAAERPRTGSGAAEAVAVAPSPAAPAGDEADLKANAGPMFDFASDAPVIFTGTGFADAGVREDRSTMPLYEALNLLWDREVFTGDRTFTLPINQNDIPGLKEVFLSRDGQNLINKFMKVLGPTKFIKMSKAIEDAVRGGPAEYEESPFSGGIQRDLDVFVMAAATVPGAIAALRAELIRLKLPPQGMRLFLQQLLKSMRRNFVR